MKRILAVFFMLHFPNMILQAVEPDSVRSQLTEEQARAIGDVFFVNYLNFDSIDISDSHQKFSAYYPEGSDQLYWFYQLTRRLDLGYAIINDQTGEIETKGWYKLSGFSKECDIFRDSGRAILRRRLTPLFERANKKAFKIYKGKGFYKMDNLKIYWDRSDAADTAFLSIEETIPPSNHFILKYFYANNQIKEKGLYFRTSNCHFKTGLWYYFDPEGNLIEVIDEDDHELFPVSEAYILDRCKKQYGYNEIEDERIRKSGLPGIQIKKIGNYISRDSEWNICWYRDTPDLVRYSLNLDSRGGHILSWKTHNVNLEKELQRLKEKKGKNNKKIFFFMID